jgi:hypothetical protein
MRWTWMATAAAALLLLLPGCAGWGRMRHPVAARSAAAGRPTASYYCYDCHGYRYLDPYYDWCPGHGFRYAWDRHPETVRVYRERYVRIKEENPSFGRFRYRAEYRDERRYREPTDYESWRSGTGSSQPASPERVKVREQDRHQPGKTSEPNQRRDRKASTRRPWNARPGGDGSGTPGGA